MGTTWSTPNNIRAIHHEARGTEGTQVTGGDPAPRTHIVATRINALGMASRLQGLDEPRTEAPLDVVRIPKILLGGLGTN